MAMHPLAPDEIRSTLEQLGLEPNGVDLAWLSRVKYDTEQQIAEYRKSPEFAAVVVMAAVPPPN